MKRLVITEFLFTLIKGFLWLDRFTGGEALIINKSAAGYFNSYKFQ